MSLFDLIAPIYDRLHPDPSGSIAAIRELAQPSPTDRLLDIGGGTGRIARGFLAEVHEVVALDPSKGMVAQARAAAGIEVARGRAESLPFADGSFDLVICVDALHHFRDHDLALIEMARVLKPGGRMVIQEFNRSTWIGRITMLLEWALRQGSRFYTPDELLEKVAGHGLRPSLRNETEARYYIAGTKILP